MSAVFSGPPMADPAPKAFTPMPVPALVSALRTIKPLPVVVMTEPPPPKLASRMASLLPIPETPLIVTSPLTAEIVPLIRSTPMLTEPVAPPVPLTVMLPEPVVVKLPPTMTPSWERVFPAPPACPVRVMFPPCDVMAAAPASCTP